MDSPLAFRFVLVAVAAYLLGGIPWALLIGRRFYGIDVREHGSGNLGATNVFRTLGAKAGIGTALLDIAKGSLAVVLAMAIISADRFGALPQEWGMFVAAIFAVLGHSYSPYVGFHGGKAVATMAGALIALTPMLSLILIALWVLLVLTTRFVSLASLIAAIAAPIVCAAIYPHDWPRLVFALAGAAVVIWRHRGNIKRMVKGGESRISLKDSADVLKRKSGSR